jgi:LysR family transcriptional regulator, transcriptional activator for bauABCD operon
VSLVRRITDVDLRQIRIFRAVVECRSLAGAELVLNLSQSRISEGLAALEARMGARLCRRGRSGFALTEAGDELYAASHELFDAVDRFCTRAGEVAPNLRRTLRIGTVDAVAGNRELPLPEVLGAFATHWPSATIDLTISGPEDLEHALANGGLDLIVTPSINRKAEFDYAPLLRERQSLYCGRRHTLFGTADEMISDADLAAQAFVARGYLHHEDLKRIGHRDPRATVQMMEAQLILVLSGGFIGYLPSHYAESRVRRGELRIIQDARRSYDSTFFVVTQRGGEENPLVRHFRTLVFSAVRREGRASEARAE